MPLYMFSPYVKYDFVVIQQIPIYPSIPYSSVILCFTLSALGRRKPLCILALQITLYGTYIFIPLLREAVTYSYL